MACLEGEVRTEGFNVEGSFSSTCTVLVLPVFVLVVNAVLEAAKLLSFEPRTPATNRPENADTNLRRESIRELYFRYAVILCFATLTNVLLNYLSEYLAMNLT